METDRKKELYSLFNYYFLKKKKKNSDFKFLENLKNKIVKQFLFIIK